MPKNPISFTKSVSANSDETATHTFQRDGRVTRIFVPTYPGQELALRYSITIETADDISQPLIQAVGEDYLAGNGETFDLDVDRDVRKGDQLKFYVENTDATYDYTANAWVSVDYAPSASSLLSKLVGETPRRSDDHDQRGILGLGGAW